MSDDLRERVARAIFDHSWMYDRTKPWTLAPENEKRLTYAMADAALAEMGGGEWTDKPDDWTDRIKADFRTDGFYSRYAQALDLVSNRHSKSALVALVCYLLRPTAIEPAPSVREAARVLCGSTETPFLEPASAIAKGLKNHGYLVPVRILHKELRAIAEGKE